MDEAYRLVVADLRTDEVVDVLPIGGVSYDDYIGKSGSFSGSIPLPGPGIAARVRQVLLPGRTMLYLERDGQVSWGGALWTRTPARDARGQMTCAVQAAGLESILRGHRLLFDNLTFTGVDQMEIARQLVAYTQALTGGQLGIEIDYSQMSGTLRDRTYSRYDLPWIGQLLDQLSAVQGGPEWRIQIYRDSSGVRHRRLILGTPLLPSAATDTVLTSPAGARGEGAITAYSLPEDATVQANTWISRGASTNSDQASASVPLMSALQVSAADLAEGWPRLDGTDDHTDVAVQATLDSYAAASLARWRHPVTIPAVTVTAPPGRRPELGSYVQLRIVDNWYPEGLSSRYRVVGYKVAPEERSRSESTDLYLEAA